ncbi:MAG: O-antigen ligase family protein [Thermoanaerobaculia bacterium]
MRRRRFPPSLSTWPAALAGLLALWIALSTAFSLDPGVSVRHFAGVLLLLALPIAMDLLEDVPRARALALSLGASGVVISLAGLLQYARGGDDLANRIRAHLSTYMTFSGLVLASGCLLLGFAFEERGRWRAVGFAAALPLGAMLLTFTRNAYVGALAALAAYLALRRPKGLLLLPAAVLLVFWLLPAGLRDRVRSIADLTDDTNRDRVAMAHAGFRMIADFPLFGLGPDLVKPYYSRYRDPDAPSLRVPHLHNNALQLAAQSGVPAAAAYLALALLVLFQAARRLRRERRPDRAALLAGAFLASVALFAAGFFEYNFGDTEIEMATLLIWAIPFAAATAPGEVNRES